MNWLHPRLQMLIKTAQARQIVQHRFLNTQRASGQRFAGGHCQKIPPPQGSHGSKRAPMCVRENRERKAERWLRSLSIFVRGCIESEEARIHFRARTHQQYLAFKSRELEQIADNFKRWWMRERPADFSCED